jgi:tetratricopeptide (TPR) repeat protein
MKIAQSLSALSLRPLLHNGTAGSSPSASGSSDVGTRLLADHAPRLAEALGLAIERTWKAVEVALAGTPWWERCKVLLEPGEELALGEPMDVFLASVPLADVNEETRLRCLRDLRSARQAGVLTSAVPPAELVHTCDGGSDGQLVEQAAGGLRDAGFAALAEFLARPGTEALLLAAALRYFLRRAIEKSELATDVDATALAALGNEPSVRFSLLGDILDRHGPRLEVLLATLDTTGATPSGFPLSIDREVQGQPESLQELAAEVRQLLTQNQLLDRELRLADSGSIRSAPVRQRVIELKTQFNALEPEQQKQLPALRYGLAMLETASADFDTAQHDFQSIAAGTTNSRVLAIVSFNQYHVALEQRDWAEALSFLERAATLWPEQLSPFPLTKYEPERILGVGASGVAFLCRNKPSETPVVVKAFWPGGLATDVAEVFREARVLEELDHANIIKLRDCDFADAAKTRPYIVTDYFDGLTLAEQVEQHGPLPADDLLAVAKAGAEALHVAHERGILHRDLKPDHFLLRKEETGWRVKVIDFSVAVQPLVLHKSLTRNDLGARPMVGASAAGTIPYAAPEVVGWVQGVPAGPHSDVYSFGKTCYFGLLGTPEPDDDEKEALPPAWRKLLAGCTARSTTRRLTNFQLVLERLGQVPLTAAPEPATKGPAAPVKADVEKLLTVGMQARQQGDYDRAIAAFSKALQLDPSQTAAFIKRGNVFLDRGDFDRAIADYTAAIKVDAKMALAYLNRGLAHAKKGDFEAVLADANHAIHIDPKLAAAHFLRGAAFANRGDKHRAIAEFSLAIKLDPKNPLTYNDRGLAYAEQGDYDRALADYTAALRLDPRLTLAYVNRGIACRQKGNIDKAIQEFTKALRLEPRSVLGYFNRGLAHLAKQDFDRAVLDFDRVLLLDPRHPEAAIRREEARRAGGKSGILVHGRNKPRPTGESPSGTRLPKVGPQTAKARPDEPASATKLPKVGPQTAEGTASSTRLPKVAAQPAGKAKTDEPASTTKVPKVEAKPSLTPEEERRQARAAAHFVRGRTHYEQKEYSQAVDQYTKAIQMDGKDPQAFYQRGLSYVAQNEYQEAIADYTSALELNPRYVQAYYHRAIAHQLLGEHDQAIADYTRTLRLEPRLAAAYRHRGQVYAAKGDQERAKADLEEAQRIDPNLGKK